MPRRVAQQLKPGADPAAIPADDRAGEAGRCRGVAVVLARGGQDCVGDRAGKFVAQPGQGLQAGGQRLVPQVARKLRPSQDQLGLVSGIPRLAAGA
jgi:hypothetical protein